MIATIAKGLPPLSAVVIGVLLYVRYVPWWLPLAGIFVGAVVLRLGRFLLPRAPVFGNLAISLWILAGIGFMAAGAASLLWLGMALPLRFAQLHGDESKAVVAALTSALTTFAGVVITKDMEQGTGPFWPATKFKKLASSVFSQATLAPPRDTKEWDAVYEDRVRGGGPIGWGFRSRHARAKIFELHLANLHNRRTRAVKPDG